jgi:signal transduction histidine kinase
MRLSISAKIFVGFVAVLAIFTAVTAYTVIAMRRLGDELRLVSSGYLELRFKVAELQNSQLSLLNLLTEQIDHGSEGAARLPPSLKSGIDVERRRRLLQQLPQAYDQLRSLGERRLSADERKVLHTLLESLDHVAASFRESEPLFDAAFGALREPAPLHNGVDRPRDAAQRLLKHEQDTKRALAGLAFDLFRRAQQTALRLEDEESRAVWAALALAVVALLSGLGVAAVAGRTLLPLRRLAERTKEIARGDYGKRVPAGGHDEVASLAREFNAMAEALDEREQRLIHSERLAAIGKIAAQITHEVRNPLSSIGLNAEQLDSELEAIPGTGEARTLARAIVKEVDRLTEITEAYLRFARMPRPRLEREELRAVIGSLIDFQRPELRAKKIDLQVVLPEIECPMACDEQQLRQALLNLTRNAGEAMPQGGLLRVGLYVETANDGTRSYRVEIADSGEGIEPANLAQIFEPFFSTKLGGTGLGLALTQQIVVEHGGSIAVESRPGQGTTFTVRVPAAPSSDGAQREARAA